MPRVRKTPLDKAVGKAQHVQLRRSTRIKKVVDYIGEKNESIIISARGKVKKLVDDAPKGAEDITEEMTKLSVQSTATADAETTANKSVKESKLKEKDQGDIQAIQPEESQPKELKPKELQPKEEEMRKWPTKVERLRAGEWITMYEHVEDEQRLKPYRANPPKDFVAKRSRALSQPIRVVSRYRYTTLDPPLELFAVHSADHANNGKLYRVRIDLVPKCSCKDWRCRKESCKHTFIKVLHYALKVPQDSPLLWQYAFLMTELRHMLRPETAAPRFHIPRDDPFTGPRRGLHAYIEEERMNADASAAPGAPAEVRYKDSKRKPIEGDCPVCYMEFEPDKERIVYCKAACGNHIHAQCLRIWIAYGEATCPYCRGGWVW